jgi:hypothetical protein
LKYLNIKKPINKNLSKLNTFLGKMENIEVTLIWIAPNDEPFVLWSEIKLGDTWQGVRIE